MTKLLKLIVAMVLPAIAVGQRSDIKWEWTLLAPIPDEVGYAGAYIGTVNGYLLVAGGANFPDGKAPWEGGKKMWTDQTYLLKEKQGAWIKTNRLPARMGYGASVSYKDKMYIAGGSNENEHLETVYEIYWDESTQNIDFKEIAKLPFRIANCASVLIGSEWYILGGLATADGKSAANNCWRMDLDYPERGWEASADLPGEGRMLAVAANIENQVVLLSGVALRNGKRVYLKDAYLLTKTGSWKSIAELPYSVAAAAGPGWYDGSSGKLFVFGGDDGRLANSDLKYEHPWFSRGILQYDLHIDKWSILRDMTLSDGTKIKVPVTTGAAHWNGSLVLPTGEVRPGIRSPQVIIGNLIKEQT